MHLFRSLRRRVIIPAYSFGRPSEFSSLVGLNRHPERGVDRLLAQRGGNFAPNPLRRRDVVCRVKGALVCKPSFKRRMEAQRHGGSRSSKTHSDDLASGPLTTANLHGTHDGPEHCPSHHVSVVSRNISSMAASRSVSVFLA